MSGPDHDPGHGDGPLGFGPEADKPPSPRPEPPPQPEQQPGREAERRRRVRAQAAARQDRGAFGQRLLSANAKYFAILGIAVLLVVAYVSIHSQSPKVGVLGLPSGARLPPFAAPLALSDLEGDVNIAVKHGQGQAGHVPACSVRGPSVLNVCELSKHGPVVLAFLINRPECVRQLDTLERARSAHPGVQFAAVALLGKRDVLRQMVRDHGWRFPVAYDHDGALASLYGVAVCPVITFALPGGRVLGTKVGVLSPTALAGRLRSLEAASRRAGWSPTPGA